MYQYEFKPKYDWIEKKNILQKEIYEMVVYKKSLEIRETILYNFYGYINILAKA